MSPLSKDGQNSLAWRTLPWLIIIILTAVVYWPIFHLGFVNYDDPLYVTDNPVVRSGITLRGISWAMTNLGSGNWHPLTWLSHMLDCQLFGLDPAGHHLTSLILHIVNSLLLFAVFNRFTGMRRQSFLLAVLFAVHPLHVESVVWISERKDVLSTFFMLTALYNYSVFSQRHSWRHYFTSLLLFGLGLTAKAMLITFPFLLFLWDIWPMRRLETANSRGWLPYAAMIREKVPFILLSMMANLVALYAQQKAGAVKSLALIPLALRTANALCSYILYLFKLVWPVHLSVFYPYPEAIAWWRSFGALLIIIGVGSGALWSIHRRPYLTMGWFWYVISLLPVIGFVQVGLQAMADRYCYIPSIGIFIIIIWGGTELLGRIERPREIFFFCFVVIAIITFISNRQVKFWQNSATLFRHDIAVAGDSPTAWLQMGNYYFHKKHYKEALKGYHQVLKIAPHNLKAQADIGLTLAEEGRYREALKCLNPLLLRAPHNPQLLNNIGIVYLRMGKVTSAVTFFQKSVVIKKDFQEALFNLAAAFYKLNNLDKATAAYKKLIEAAPYLAKAYNGLGVIYARQGLYEAAAKKFQTAIHLAPDNTGARDNLSNIKKIIHGRVVKS